MEPYTVVEAFHGSYIEHSYEEAFVEKTVDLDDRFGDVRPLDDHRY